MPAKKPSSYTLPISIEQIDIDGFHIFCNISIEGKPYRAIIDTGASKTVFSDKLINTLNNLEIIQQDENVAAGIGADAVSAKIAIIPRINLGKKQVRNLIVGVMDVSHIEDHYAQMGIKPFDVIIGGDVLNKKKCSINYADKVLTIM